MSICAWVEVALAVAGRAAKDRRDAQSARARRVENARILEPLSSRVWWRDRREVSWLPSLPAAPSRPHGQWLPHGVRRASLGHSGGPAPVFHRLPRPPIRGLVEARIYRRFGHPDFLAAASGFRLMIVKRSREPGANPGLTRNGDGQQAPLRPWPESEYSPPDADIRTPVSRTDGRSLIPLALHCVRGRRARPSQPEGDP